MVSKIERVLVISAHSDDGEIGCGGTMAKLLEEAAEVTYLYFVLPPIAMNQPAAQQETDEALQALGIDKVIHCKLDGYANRMFHAHRQEILDALVWTYRDVRPDMVFTLSSLDTHQDHAVVASETFRACKKCTILGYDFPWNMPRSQLGCYIAIEQKHLDKKVASIQKNTSQLFRPQLSVDAVTALATVRGAAIGKQYAEAFEVIRWVM